MRSRVRFITVLTAAALYAAVAVLGQGLHTLTCPHDAHECHASQSAGDGLHAEHAAGHDADSCPICQACAQAHALPIQSAPSYTTLCQRHAHVVGDRLLPSPLLAPYLARGPPAA